MELSDNDSIGVGKRKKNRSGKTLDVPNSQIFFIFFTLFSSVENYVCRDALSRQSTECSEVQEASQSQLQQSRVKLNGSTVETPSHHDLHRELLVSTKRGLLPGEKPELKRVLEQRRLEQHREQELALQPPLELETELRKRQQILLEYEQEEIRRREEQEREVPEFVRVKDNLRRTQVSGQ
uniref:Zgc:195245 n=1 Tax=Oncorhynchus mykiss TaxID=8022 RepID=A0A8L0DRS6_ONCMY